MQLPARSLGIGWEGLRMKDFTGLELTLMEMPTSDPGARRTSRVLNVVLRKGQTALVAQAIGTPLYLADFDLPATENPRFVEELRVITCRLQAVDIRLDGHQKVRLTLVFSGKASPKEYLLDRLGGPGEFCAGDFIELGDAPMAPDEKGYVWV